MKKDRNCGMSPYPVYPAYPGMMPSPNMVQPMQPGMMQMNPGMQSQPYAQPYISQQGTGNTIEQQVSSLNNQVNSLERRVSSLESLVGSSTSKYNNSNYQIM